MAAPEGNQFWKLRSKHGRDKLFATPALMLEAACEYFEWCDQNPFIESKPMVVSSGGNTGSSIEMAEIPVKRPYTIQGLCLYLNCNTAYFRQFKTNCIEDFSTVIAEIEEVIYNQQFSGAVSGFFKENIISRNLGLKDQKDITSNGNEINPITQVEIIKTNEDKGNG